MTTGIFEDIQALAALADDRSREALTRVASVLEPSLRLRILEVLNDVVADLNAAGGPGTVEIRWAGDDVTLVFSAGATTNPEPPADLNARVALRLPDEAKSQIEERATHEGVSVNSWIVRSLLSQLGSGATASREKPGRHLRGTGRS